MSGQPVKFGPYSLLGTVGQGVTGDVFRATLLAQQGQGPVLALKRFHTPFSRDPGFRSAFWEGVGAARQLEHPGLSPILSAGEVDGTLFVTRPLIPGCSLRALLNHLKSMGAVVPPSIAISCVLELADTLTAIQKIRLEKAPFVHGRLSPENIMLDAQGHCTILDLGTSGPSAWGQASLWWLDPSSLPYLPPESLGTREADLQFDVYSLGAILVELLTSAPPFNYKTPLEAIDSLRRLDLRSLRTRLLEQGFEREMIDLIEWALDPDPSRRLEDGSLFHTYLKEQAPELGMGSSSEVFWGELITELQGLEDEAPPPENGIWDLMFLQGDMPIVPMPPSDAASEVQPEKDVTPLRSDSDQSEPLAITPFSPMGPTPQGHFLQALVQSQRGNVPHEAPPQELSQSDISELESIEAPADEPLDEQQDVLVEVAIPPDVEAPAVMGAAIEYDADELAYGTDDDDEDEFEDDSEDEAESDAFEDESEDEAESDAFEDDSEDEAESDDDDNHNAEVGAVVVARGSEEAGDFAQAEMDFFASAGESQPETDSELDEVFVTFDPDDLDDDDYEDEEDDDDDDDDYYPAGDSEEGEVGVMVAVGGGDSNGVGINIDPTPSQVLGRGERVDLSAIYDHDFSQNAAPPDTEVIELEVGSLEDSLEDPDDDLDSRPTADALDQKDDSTPYAFGDGSEDEDGDNSLDEDDGDDDSLDEDDDSLDEVDDEGLDKDDDSLDEVDDEGLDKDDDSLDEDDAASEGRFEPEDAKTEEGEQAPPPDESDLPEPEMLPEDKGHPLNDNASEQIFPEQDINVQDRQTMTLSRAQVKSLLNSEEDSLSLRQKEVLATLQSLDGEASPLGLDEIFTAFGRDGTQKTSTRTTAPEAETNSVSPSATPDVERLKAQLATGTKRRRSGALPEGTILEGQLKIVRRIEVGPHRALYEAVPAPEALTRRCWECGYAHNTRDDRRCYRCRRPLGHRRFCISARWSKKLVAQELELVVAQVEHPSLDPIYGWLVHEGQLCRIMELRSDELLAMRSDLDEATINFIAMGLCDAFAYLAEKGIVLRELLPSQVIVTESEALLYDPEVGNVRGTALNGDDLSRGAELIGRLLTLLIKPQKESAIQALLSNANTGSYSSPSALKDALCALEERSRV